MSRHTMNMTVGGSDNPGVGPLSDGASERYQGRGWVRQRSMNSNVERNTAMCLPRVPEC
jgi:hypothetical protein